MARIILAHCGNGYAGCDAEDLFIYDNLTDDKIITDEVYAWACDHAESYAYVHFGRDEEYTDEDYDEYLEEYMTLNWQDITYDEAVEWCENYGYDIKDYLRMED